MTKKSLLASLFKREEGTGPRFTCGVPCGVDSVTARRSALRHPGVQARDDRREYLNKEGQGLFGSGGIGLCFFGWDTVAHPGGADDFPDTFDFRENSI